MRIEKFLEFMHNEFVNELKTRKNLCILKSLDYRGKKAPDYRDPFLEMYYLLMYAYAYVAEYRLMYKRILNMFLEKKELNVVSLGCGSLLDYAGLNDVNISQKKIKYTGVDLVDWRYKILTNKDTNVNLVTGKALGRYFFEQDKLSADVYIFPKSISEISFDEIEYIKKQFEKKRIVPNKICLCASLRNIGDDRRNEDIKKLNIISEGIIKNGYLPGEDNNTYYYFEGDDKIVDKISDYFKYPYKTMKVLNSLNDHCINKEKCLGSSDEKCIYKTFPILKTKYICYMIKTFEREGVAA